ncbi:MAG: hypothetical protein ACRDA7_03215 [Metamycoplasmataceae bacterium]
MKNKKILLGLGAATIFSIGLLATTVSCSASEQQSTLISGVKELSEQYHEKLTQNKEKFAPEPARLITAGGNVKDFSFNQSIWEGLEIFQNQMQSIVPGTKNFVSYTETLVPNELPSAYNAALNSGQKVWILTGFQQVDFIEAFLNEGSNYQKFVDQKIKIVSVDWVVDVSASTKTPNLKKLFDLGAIITLNFKTQEPAYVMGYALSQYLTENFTNKDDWSINSFGGGIFPGVSLFNNGLLAGMAEWNKASTGNKIQFVSGQQGISGTTTDTILMNSGFEPSDTAAQQAIQAAKNSKAKAFFPVAGSLTNSLLTEINQNQLIVGVDSDQALAIPSYKNLFFTSIEKKVGIAVYESLIKILFPSVTGILSSTNQIDTYDYAAKKSVQALGGYNEGWVGTSPNITSDKATADKINALIKAAKDKFYGASSATPNFGLVGSDPAANQKLLDGIIKEINTR